MDALVNAAILIFIFGGGFFIISLIRFTLIELIERARHRRHTARIAQTLELRHYHRHI